MICIRLKNCKIELDLPWSKKRVVSETSKTSLVVQNPPPPAEPATLSTGTTFQINSTKPYVSVGTWSISDNIKFS